VAGAFQQTTESLFWSRERGEEVETGKEDCDFAAKGCGYVDMCKNDHVALFPFNSFYDNIRGNPGKWKRLC
jgi:hypothetical protein